MSSFNLFSQTTAEAKTLLHVTDNLTPFCGHTDVIKLFRLFPGETNTEFFQQAITTTLPLSGSPSMTESSEEPSPNTSHYSVNPKQPRIGGRHYTSTN